MSTSHELKSRSRGSMSRATSIGRVRAPSDVAHCNSPEIQGLCCCCIHNVAAVVNNLAAKSLRCLRWSFVTSNIGEMDLFITSLSYI